MKHDHDFENEEEVTHNEMEGVGFTALFFVAVPIVILAAIVIKGVALIFS